MSNGEGLARLDPEPGVTLAGPRQRPVGGVAEGREVAHLSSRPGLALAVEREPDAGDLEGRREVGGAALRPEVAEQVDDGRRARRLDRAQGKRAGGPHELLELPGRARRLAPVMAVVRARGELVDQQASVAGEEELDAEEPDHAQRLGDGGGELVGALDQRRIEAARQGRPVEDPVDVVVARRRVGDGGAVDAAGDQDRELGLEGKRLLDHARALAHRAPGRAPGGGAPVGGRRAGKQGFAVTALGVLVERGLAAPVVAAEARLGEDAPAERLHGGDELLLARRLAEGPDRKAARLEPALLPHAILDDVEHRRRGAKRRMLLGRGQRLGGDLLDLEGDDRHAAGQRRRGLRVVEAGGDHLLDDRGGRAMGIGVEDVHLVAERTRGQRGHAPELPAAQDAERRAGQDRPAHGTPSPSTSSRRASLHARSRAASSGWRSATMRAARSAALAAPGLPMASVPTGTPFGIWAIDRKASTPASAVAGTGTPSTGSTVFAAVMPGRWAAPPAAAMITSRPRPSAADAYSNMRSGVRCAEMIRTSWGTSSSRRSASAGSIVSRSLRLPMITPTQGARASLMAASWSRPRGLSRRARLRPCTSSTPASWAPSSTRPPAPRRARRSPSPAAPMSENPRW